MPDFDYVSKWFEKAVRYGVVPETPIVNHIIGEVAKIEGLEKAEEWFEKATSYGVKANAGRSKSGLSMAFSMIFSMVSINFNSNLDGSDWISHDSFEILEVYTYKYLIQARPRPPWPLFQIASRPRRRAIRRCGSGAR